MPEDWSKWPAWLLANRLFARAERQSEARGSPQPTSNEQPSSVRDAQQEKERGIQTTVASSSGNNSPSDELPWIKVMIDDDDDRSS